MNPIAGSSRSADADDENERLRAYLEATSRSNPADPAAAALSDAAPDDHPAADAQESPHMDTSSLSVSLSSASWPVASTSF